MKTDTKIVCEICNSSVSKGYYKKHQQTKKCKALQVMPYEVVKEGGKDYISTLPDDVLKCIFEMLLEMQQKKRGYNNFSNIRLVSMDFNNVVIDFGKDKLIKQGIDKPTDLDGLVYILSFNRYIGTTKCVDNYLISRRILQTMPKMIAKGYMSNKTFLYHKDEIVLIALKNNHIEELKDKCLQRSIKLQDSYKKREKKKEKEINNRRNELDIALKKCGLKLRQDSRLCELYIKGKNNLILEDVVERMANMKYIYECHNFKRYVNDNKHNYIWFDIDELEYEYLQEIGGYPEVYPWLNDTIENILNNKN